MNGLSAYQNTAVATQNQGRLVVLLYEGAIKFLRMAVKEIEARDWAAKGRHIVRAIDIINELNNELKMEEGGEIAQNLRKLYAFMVRHLGEANIKRDPERIQQVISILDDLNQGWKEVTS
jgi:flagellar protein FliS